MVELALWICVLGILYTYLLYPLILKAVADIREKPVRKGNISPRVSVLLSAFNEERFIEAKILNLLDQDYPQENLEILVGSDGASDETDRIVSKFKSSRVRFFRFVANRGKPGVLNSLVREARGTILIFTDARQKFERNAVKHLVNNFADDAVGCVSGELFFQKDEGKAVERGMGAYWKYEKYLRKTESRIGSMLGATGAIYAVRRKLFKDVPQDMLVDDMFIPLTIIRQGYRAVFDPKAVAYDMPSNTGLQEVKRKARTLAGNFQIFAKFPDLLFSISSPIAWQLFSHKFMRLVIPYLMTMIFVLNLFMLDRPFYLFIFVVQILFYALAIAEGIFESKKSGARGIGFVPYTFCVLNYSAVLGLYQFMSGKTKAAWEKAYA